MVNIQLSKKSVLNETPYFIQNLNYEITISWIMVYVMYV